MKYSVVMPSKSLVNIDLCVSSLQENSLYLNDIIVLWDGNEEMPSTQWFKERPIVLQHDVYGMYNYGVEQAASEWVLLVNDDMYFPPKWDMGLLWDSNYFPWYTWKVVESGYTEVNNCNIEKDFGKSPAEFNKQGFIEYAKVSSSHSIKQECGWYMPVLLHKEIFLELGGYPNVEKFPAGGNDITLFKKAEEYGVQFLKLDSVIYHFQCLSWRI